VQTEDCFWDGVIRWSDDSHWLCELAEATQLKDSCSFDFCNCQGLEELATGSKAEGSIEHDAAHLISMTRQLCQALHAHARCPPDTDHLIC